MEAGLELPLALGLAVGLQVGAAWRQACGAGRALRWPRT